jgi:hypothetical protein
MKQILLRLPDDLALSTKRLAQDREISVAHLLRDLLCQEMQDRPYTPRPESDDPRSGRTSFRFQLPCSLDAQLEAQSSKRLMTKSAYLRYLIHQDAKNQKT